MEIETGLLNQLLFAFILDLVFLHFLIERRAVDPEGTGGVLTVPTVRFQSFHDELAFRFGHRSFETAAIGGQLEVLLDGAMTADGFRQIVHRDFIGLGQHNRPFDDIDQLSHVAGPIVLLHETNGRRVET